MNFLYGAGIVSTDGNPAATLAMLSFSGRRLFFLGVVALSLLLTRGWMGG